MRKLLLTFLTLSSILNASQTEANRIHAHLILCDPETACSEAQAVLNRNPQDQAVWQAYIQALAKAGDEKSMVAAWNRYVQLFPDDHENRELLEAMAWGVIEEGAKSSSPIQRIISMLAAHMTRDIKGIAILKNNLKDRNALVRSVGLQLSSQHRDAELADEVLGLFRTEKNWEVRLEAIKAIGPMHIKEAEEELLQILSHQKTRAEEKLAAIQSLANLFDQVERRQIEQLTQSNRGGLRMLGSYIVRHFGMSDEGDLIIPLLNDTSPEVRAEALQTLGVLRISEANGKDVTHIATHLLQDPDHKVAISAAWYLTIQGRDSGSEALHRWLSHRKKETRRLAASALAATGKYGIETLRKAFFEEQEPYVKLNLALGLISQRVDTQAACQALYTVLVNDTSRWNWEEQGIFRVLAESRLRHRTAIPNYPEAVNQMTRLEILNLLAMMNYPGAQSAIKQFLQEHKWGITGTASAVLLTEGDDEAIDLVKKLIEDPNSEIQIQAALVLALWGKDEKAIEVLQKSYNTSDRQMKEKILEGIGRVGAMSSVPFLVDGLDESYPTLRMISASSLLLCLYH